jgi:hypothetical protein
VVDVSHVIHPAKNAQMQAPLAVRNVMMDSSFLMANAFLFAIPTLARPALLMVLNVPLAMIL